MNNPLDAHPDEEQLSAFDLGCLPADQWSAIESHISQCSLCCEKLERVPDDSLLLAVRAAVRPKLIDTANVAVAATPSIAAEQAPAEIPSALAAHPRYRILGLLGSGGMGAVYLAEHRLMDRPVALKVIKPLLTAQPGSIERFRKEIKAAARLAHPNIAMAFDAEQAGDVHFLVMEFIEGITLERRIVTSGPAAPGEACEWARQAALGLQHAYESGMVHRDIKPGNLMLTPGGRIKVLDFGLARFASEVADSPLTETGVVVGTPDFIAPEQALDPRQADIRADIYSLGCTLYYLLTGRPPFPGGTALQKILAHQDQPPRSLSECRPGLPGALIALVNRMMAKAPADRFLAPGMVAEALLPFVTTTLMSAPASLSSSRTTATPRRPRRLLVAGALLTLGVLVGGAISLVGLSRSGTERHAPARLIDTPTEPIPEPSKFAGATEPTIPPTSAEVEAPRDRLQKRALGWLKENAYPTVRGKLMVDLRHKIETDVQPHGSFWYRLDGGLVASGRQTFLIGREGELHALEALYPVNPPTPGKGGTLFRGMSREEPEIQAPPTYTLSNLNLEGAAALAGTQPLKGTVAYRGLNDPPGAVSIRLSYYDNGGAQISRYKPNLKLDRSGKLEFEFPPLNDPKSNLSPCSGPVPVFVDLICFANKTAQRRQLQVSNSLTTVIEVVTTQPKKEPSKETPPGP